MTIFWDVFSYTVGLMGGMLAALFVIAVPVYLVYLVVKKVTA